ncbi:bifunctional folylpolyglutamate synthase/dihydrofolate synthase [Furfurilactobacillus entadae]|uniref:bifunctional folylpolyglutamate synthase/dihydrofolate synthase n=1 Tax=Furfurilactobacillus entadae TaxID=2922307 RepID=UPI0035EF60F8
MAILTYEVLLATLNRAMLAGFDDRVPLLRKILAAAGAPDHAAPKIHVVGTNGKGSTVALTAAILQAAEFTVGTFSSPAISDDREQIQINGQLISQDAFVASYQALLPTVIAVAGASDQLSIFEWEFLIAVWWFANQHVDMMLFEAGLGGLMDATNAISAPLLSVVTHIALDHTRILGPTITDIAQNKAGIIKSGTTVVLADGEPMAAITVVEAAAKAKNAPLKRAQVSVQLTHVRPETTGTRMDIHLAEETITDVRLNLVGEHQVTNAATVVTIINQLRLAGWQISAAAIRTGFERVQLPGRMTYLPETTGHPALWIDGAHNPDGMQALVKTLRQLYPNKRLTFVLGFLADKNVDEMLAQVLPLADRVILTVPDQHERALASSALAEKVTAVLTRQQLADVAVQLAPTAQMALTLLRETPGSTPIVITGSFYLIRALREAGLNE